MVSSKAFVMYALVHLLSITANFHAKNSILLWILLLWISNLSIMLFWIIALSWTWRSWRAVNISSEKDKILKLNHLSINIFFISNYQITCCTLCIYLRLETICMNKPLSTYIRGLIYTQLVWCVWCFVWKSKHITRNPTKKMKMRFDEKIIPQRNHTWNI